MDALEGAADLGIDPDIDRHYMYIAERYAEEGNVDRQRYYKRVFERAREVNRKIIQKLYKLEYETYEKLTCRSKFLLLEGITVREQP